MTTTPEHRSKLIRFLVAHAAIGVAIAVLMVGFTRAFDLMNLWTLVSSSDAGLLAITVMTVFFAITLGSAQMGFALMFAMTHDEPPSRASRAAFVERVRKSLLPIPVPAVPAPSRRRRRGA